MTYRTKYLIYKTGFEHDTLFAETEDFSIIPEIKEQLAKDYNLKYEDFSYEEVRIY